MGPKPSGVWSRSPIAHEIGGRYELGTGFLGLGAIVVSDINFKRIFPKQALEDVTFGLVTLRSGDPERIAARLRDILPQDIWVFTRKGLAAHEVAYWRKRTSVGLIFGLGVTVSIVVGFVILYQVLTTQATRQLRQYATLKAMGYTNGALQRIILNNRYDHRGHCLRAGRGGLNGDL